MANYKEIKGFHVQSLSSDPVASSFAAASWASGGNMNRGNNISAIGAGTANTAAIAAGGKTGGPPYAEVAVTEKYNGSSWTEVGDLNSARDNAAGTPNSPDSSMLYFSGTPPGTGVALTESWNGASWTEVADLTTPRGSAAGAGVSNTSGLCFTGESPEGGGSGPHSARAEKWNGSSWTEVGDLNTGRREAGGTGIQTAALCIGGSEDPPPNINKVEQFNGTSWTEIAELNTARNENASAGTVTSALTFGGRVPSKTANTEHWDGTSWTEVNNLSTARSDTYAGGGTATSTIMAGGETSTAYTNVTEEWTTPSDFTKMITGQVYFNSSSTDAFKVTQDKVSGGTWASGASMNTARRYLAGVGSKDAGLAFGGGEPSTSAKTESYNGTAWTEVSDLNAAQLAMGSAGTSTSGMSALGSQSPGAQVEDWNGASWTSNPHSLNSARQFPGGDGPSNDLALMVGGEPSPNSALTETYNGSTWTETGDLNDARNQLAGVGTTTAFLAVGGSPNNQSAEEFDGTSWTEVADMSNGGPGLGASGESTLAIAFAGGNPVIATNEFWNGTSWTEVGDLSNGRNFFASSNNPGATSAFAAAGENDSTLITNTEEWAVSTANYTITLG